MFRDLINKFMNRTKKVVTLSATRSSGGEFLFSKTDFGRISVDCGTIQKIAERALAQVKGIHEPEVEVEKVANAVAPIKIRLTTALAEGISAVTVSEEANNVINAALGEFLSPEFRVPISVRIKQITRVVEQKRRRVR